MKKISQALLLLSVFIGISLFASCFPFGAIKGSGNLTKETRNVSGFDFVKISGSFDVVLKQDSVESLTIETDDNIQEHVKTEVTGNVLKIKTDKLIIDATQMKIVLGVKNLKKVECSGSVELETMTPMTFDDFNLVMSGSAEVRMNINASILDALISGSGNLQLSGTAKKASYFVSGSGSISAYELKSDDVTIDISGSADANVCVASSLDVSISGSGDVKYKGTPAKMKQHISGSGSLEQVE